jgi:hypothetical protein
MVNTEQIDHTSNQNDCRALTRKSFAARWEISERFVNILIHDGILPVVKLGRKCVRIPIEEGDKALLRYKSEAQLSKGATAL